jgi:pyruvate/2-oxoglutarate dehydrogenase complex dihydrolipoamide dehydrogenase (E3) component
MNKYTHDIIIIGAGSGGLNVAAFCARIKLKVLLVDKSATHIGGDCLNTGCVPSKALIHVANQVHASRLSNKFKSSSDSSPVDIQKVTEYIKSKQDHIRQNENPEYLKEKGIEYISGSAMFVDAHTIEVDGKRYSAKKFVLATGSRARALSVPNDKSIKEYTNENIFEIDFLPNEFVFIGGGPINCELGQAFARLGSKVTILTTSERILEKETKEVSAVMESVFKDEGIEIVTGITIQEIKNGSVCYSTIGGETSSKKADAIFVGIGRVLNIENLQLEKAGIQVNQTKSKLIVDEYLRTTNKNIYVVGDVAGNYQFTHVAEMHAKVVIANMLSPLKQKFDSKYIAWVTYTSPEIATWGVGHEAATARGFETISADFVHDDRAIVDESVTGRVDIYVDAKGTVYGGTMVAQNAGELSQELILAMSAGLGLKDIFNKVYPYPVASRINKQISSAWMGRKLTTNTAQVLRFLFKSNS